MLGEGYVPHPLNDTMLCRSASTPVNDLSTSPVARVLDKLYYHTFTRSSLYLTHSPTKKKNLHFWMLLLGYLHARKYGHCTVLNFIYTLEESTTC